MGRRLEAAFLGLLLACAWVAAAILAAIALLIPANVVLRAAGGGIYGLLDAIEYGLLAATFLAAPWVLSLNAHVSVDLLVDALTGAPRRTVERLANVLGAVVAGTFLWFALEAVFQSAARGAMIRTAFTIPEWWILAIPPAGMALVVLEFVRKLVRGRGAASAAGL